MLQMLVRLLIMSSPKHDINSSNAAVEPEKETKKSKKDKKKKAAVVQDEPVPASDVISLSGALYPLSSSLCILSQYLRTGEEKEA